MTALYRSAWEPDTVLPGFARTTLTFPSDYDGRVVATVLRKRCPSPTTRAVLYVHGFIDYFFQAHVAARFVDHGYNFYALDLRKHGRSLLPYQCPNYCETLEEYFPELTAAIDIVGQEEGNTTILLNGHSTGGLLAVLYAADGARRADIDMMFLNSPFFEFNINPLLQALLPAGITLAARWPRRAIPGVLNPLYGQSLHERHHGEWRYDEQWKPLGGFPVRLAWVRAIYRAQKRLHRGLELRQPVLVMHSARTVRGRRWNSAYNGGDAVLNVGHIRRWARAVGNHVTTVAIPGGLHDLTLSRREVREWVFARLFNWLDVVVPRIESAKISEPVRTPEWAPAVL